MNDSGSSLQDIAEYILDKASKQTVSYCEARVEEYSNETLNVEGEGHDHPSWCDSRAMISSCNSRPMLVK